jgi:hypothetical protein
VTDVTLASHGISDRRASVTASKQDQLLLLAIRGANLANKAQLVVVVQFRHHLYNLIPVVGIDRRIIVNLAVGVVLVAAHFCDGVSDCCIHLFGLISKSIFLYNWENDDAL